MEQVQVTFNETPLRRMSIIRGLEIPEGESLYSKVENPSLHELELASRPHRWPKMRELQKNFFHAFIDKVTKHEIEILEILNLPSINEIRKVSLIDEPVESEKHFKYTELMHERLGAEFKEWMEEFLGWDN